MKTRLEVSICFGRGIVSVATALGFGHKPAAERGARFSVQVQQKPTAAFRKMPGSTQAFWNLLQLDESLPLILYQLGKFDKATTKITSKAADFIVKRTENAEGRWKRAISLTDCC